MAVEERYACVMLHNPQITFKIWLNEGILPEIWPAERERQHRAVKAKPVVMMEQRYRVTGRGPENTGGCDQYHHRH